MKKLTLIGTGVMVHCLLLSLNVNAATLEQRVEALETDAMIAHEVVDENSRAADRQMKVSGYVDFEYSYFGDQAGKFDGFRLHHFSTFFTKQISDDWRFFSEIEWENGPKFEGPETGGVLKADEGKIFAEAINVDYLHDPTLNLRIGRFFTPAGIWSVDHYPPFVSTQQRPGHIRKIFPQLIDGADVYGTIPVGDNTFINYDAYVGNGEGNTGAKDTDSKKAVGLKVSAILPALKFLEVGATVYMDSRDAKNANAEKTSTGFHAKAKQGAWTGQFEYASAELTPFGGGSDDELDGFYLQILYDWMDWTFGYRHDEFDSDSDDATTLTDDSTETLIVNYHISPTMVVKLEHNMKDDESDTVNDPTTTTATIAIFFGE